ncbi:hypothetical protein [Kitasatospora nipponensis]|uniref:hypothetical protein n=1 Tax=Kitasatospora nipponensis TaxID=258049 RepID=UPI0031D72C65
MEKHRESSRLTVITKQAREEAASALERLTAALTAAGLVLPSAGLDSSSPFTGMVLVDFGRARPDVVVELADLLTDGLNARAQHQL